MIRFAEHEARLAVPDENGVSLRHLLEAREERRRHREPGYQDPRLVPIAMPECGSYLWDMFCELSTRRQPGFGISPLLPSEVGKWCEQMHYRLLPWEFRTLYAMDTVWCAELQKATPSAETKTEEGEQKPKSRRGR